MVYVFWGQYNFVYTGETTDCRAALFSELLPENLNAYDEELSEHFDNVWGRYNKFLRTRVKFYSDWFLDKTTSGEELMSPPVHQRVPPQKIDDIVRPGGLVFGKREVINFYLKMLVHVETNVLPMDFRSSHIGWLMEDEDDVWYEKMRLLALRLIMLYVRVECKKRGSYSSKAMNKDLSMAGFSCDSFPTFKKPKDLGTVAADGVHLPKPYGDDEPDTYEEVLVNVEKVNESEEIMCENNVLDEIDEEAEFDFMMPGIKERADRVAKAMEESFTVKLTKEYTKKNIEPLSIAKDYFFSSSQIVSSPQWHLDAEGQAWGKMSFWGKMWLYEEALEREQARLEACMLDCSFRLKAMKTKKLHLQELKRLLEIRRQRLAGLMREERAVLTEQKPNGPSESELLANLNWKEVV